MPAKGCYFLNEGEEGPDQDALYEKYRLTSQHGPLLLTLLVVAIAACIALVAIAFGSGVSEGSPPAEGASLGFRSPLRRLVLRGQPASSRSLSFHVCKVLCWWKTGFLL